MNPLETYLTELRDIRSSGAAVKETSYYGPLANLLNEVGKDKNLRPKVRCIINILDCCVLTKSRRSVMLP